MARWRDVKKGKVEQNNDTAKKEAKQQTASAEVPNASTSPLFRIKAFITDMFMLMMPIMYITTYLIMEGKDDFQGSETARWATMAIYGLITIIFWVKKGQTPGFKAYSLHLIDDQTGKKPTIILAVARYAMFIVSAVTIVGFLLPFFRKDKKTLQDVICQTSVVRIDD